MTINFADFPNMREGNYRKTSDPLPDENCNRRMHARARRMVGARARSLLAPWGSILQSQNRVAHTRLRYAAALSPAIPPIMSRNTRRLPSTVSGGAVHDVVRQLSKGGTWTSKLGKEDDIDHATLEVLVGPKYGEVVKIMRRRRSGNAKPKCCESE